jgi:hypothetical protein
VLTKRGLVVLTAILWSTAGQPARWELARETRFGNTSDSDVVTRVRHVRVAADGRTYLVSRHATPILVYDARGKLLARFVRSGMGPSEAEIIFSMGLVGDTVWVWSESGGRIATFSLNGKFRSAWTYAGDPLVIRPGTVPVDRFPDGLSSSCIGMSQQPSHTTCTEDRESPQLILSRPRAGRGLGLYWTVRASSRNTLYRTCRLCFPPAVRSRECLSLIALPLQRKASGDRDHGGRAPRPPISSS